MYTLSHQPLTRIFKIKSFKVFKKNTLNMENDTYKRWFEIKKGRSFKNRDTFFFSSLKEINEFFLI